MTLNGFTAQDELLTQALAAADQAIAIAPDLADVYVTRGFLWETRQDWERARRDLDRALALDPDSSDVQHALGGLMWSLGRAPEAIAAFQRAIALDPLAASTMANLGYLLAATGRYTEARQVLERARELDSVLVFAPLNLAQAELLDARPDAALEVFRLVPDEAFRLYGAALAEHTRGNRARSEAALRELIAKNPHDAAYQVAAVYAWRGEHDRAFEWLERARVQRDGGLTLLLLDPFMRSLHADARWSPFVAKVGLPTAVEEPSRPAR